MADATQVQRRRGTASQCESMVPAEAEIIVDLTNDTTRVGDGIRSGGFIQPNFNQIQTQQFVYAVAGGTANAITVDLSPALIGYVGGTSIEFRASNNNTGAATININGLGARDIYKLSGGALVPISAGDIVSGVVYRVTYDGTQFQVTNAEFSPPAPTGGLVKLLTYDLTLATAFPTHTITVPSGYTSYRIDITNYSGASLSLFNGTSGTAGALLVAGIASSNAWYEMIRGSSMINISGIALNGSSLYVNALAATPSVIAPFASSVTSGTLTLYGRH